MQANENATVGEHDIMRMHHRNLALFTDADKAPRNMKIGLFPLHTKYKKETMVSGGSAIQRKLYFSASLFVLLLPRCVPSFRDNMIVTARWRHHFHKEMPFSLSTLQRLSHSWTHFQKNTVSGTQNASAMWTNSRNGQILYSFHLKMLQCGRDLNLSVCCLFDCLSVCLSAHNATSMHLSSAPIHLLSLHLSIHLSIWPPSLQSDLAVTFLVVGPYVEGALPQQLAQVTQVSLQTTATATDRLNIHYDTGLPLWVTLNHSRSVCRALHWEKKKFELLSRFTPRQCWLASEESQKRKNVIW